MPRRLYIPLTSTAVGLLLLGLVGVAQAVDGVVLIDQNRALAGGVTSCDTPGFPVTICQPGSYRLSGNLTAPAGVSGIFVNSDNVAIDLNGFVIRGQDLTTPGGQPFGVFGGSCDQPTFPEVTVCHFGVAVRNGTITGFFNGLDLVRVSATVSGIHAHNNTNVGIRVSHPGIIRDSVADNNGAGIIVLDCPVLITNNAAANNDSSNIRVAQPAPNSCVVTNNATP
jgi:hypothetical protein